MATDAHPNQTDLVLDGAPPDFRFIVHTKAENMFLKFAECDPHWRHLVGAKHVDVIDVKLMLTLLPSGKWQNIQRG